MIKHLLLLLSFIFIRLAANAQGVVVIPTVVHVIYHSKNDSVPDAQVFDQMRIINEDFRKLNPDTITIPQPFLQFTGDAGIEFCLAQRDPNGNPTTGIVKTYSPFYEFEEMDSISHTALGGQDGWDPHKYLNIWVVPKLGRGFGTITGFATFPITLAPNPEMDGIYLNGSFFGTIGTAAPNQVYKGRFAIYQLGHWLNLYSSGGNGAGCRTDSVSDTPPEVMVASNCPSFPFDPNNSCGSDSNGTMYMNFMSFSSCQVMFTNGQVARMHDCLNTYRSSLLSSNGCTAVGVNERTEKMNIKLLPNPTSGSLFIQINNLEKAKVVISDILGQVIYQSYLTLPQSSIDLSAQAAGIYFVQVTSGDKSLTQKIIKE